MVEQLDVLYIKSMRVITNCDMHSVVRLTNVSDYRREANFLVRDKSNY